MQRKLYQLRRRWQRFSYYGFSGLYLNRRKARSLAGWSAMLGVVVITASIYGHAWSQVARAQAAAAAAPASLPAAAAVPPPAPAAPVTLRSDGGGTYIYGTCTWYVARRRYVPPGWHDADNWLAAARQAGWATGPTPKPGAIAWTPQGRYGHVAFVEAVSGGLVTVSEMNFYGWDRVDRRTVPSGNFYYIY